MPINSGCGLSETHLFSGYMISMIWEVLLSVVIVFVAPPVLHTSPDFCSQQVFFVFVVSSILRVFVRLLQ